MIIGKLTEKNEKVDTSIKQFTPMAHSVITKNACNTLGQMVDGLCAHEDLGEICARVTASLLHFFAILIYFYLINVKIFCN